MEPCNCHIPDASYDEAKLRELNNATRNAIERYVERWLRHKIPVADAVASFDCRVVGLEYFVEAENDILGNQKHDALTKHIPLFTREHLAFGMGITPEHYSVYVDHKNISEVVFRAPIQLKSGSLIRAHVFTGQNSLITCPVPRGYCIRPKRLDQLEGIVRAYQIDVLGKKGFLGLGKRQVERSYVDELYVAGIGLEL